MLSSIALSLPRQSSLHYTLLNTVFKRLNTRRKAVSASPNRQSAIYNPKSVLPFPLASAVRSGTIDSAIIRESEGLYEW
jgi:hypothetical protein